MAKGVKKYWGERKQIKEAIKLALHHRKLVKEGHMGVFIIPLALALAKDGLFDPLNNVIVGYFLSIPTAVYLFIFMWGRGKWKLRIIILLLSIADLIPAANLLPMTTIYVLWGYYFARRQAKQSIGIVAEAEYWINETKNRLQLDSQRERLAQMAQEMYEQQFSASENREESQGGQLGDSSPSERGGYYPTNPPPSRRLDTVSTRS